MSVNCKCDECNKEIEVNEDTFCKSCFVDLEESLTKATDKITELEKQLKKGESDD